MLMLNASEPLYNDYLAWRDPSQFRKEFIDLMKIQKYDPRCRICLSFTGNYSLRDGEKLN